jgi:hypothetical protein
MPQIAFQSSDAKRFRASAETRLAAFADHLNVPYDGVLQFLRRQESFSAGSDEAGDAAAAFQHVV